MTTTTYGEKPVWGPARPHIGPVRLLISWFGIRGIGSMYYLMFAVNHGLPETLAEQLIAITLTVVASSVVLHGISVTPLMNRYARRKAHRQAMSRP